MISLSLLVMPLLMQPSVLLDPVLHHHTVHPYWACPPGPTSRPTDLRQTSACAAFQNYLFPGARPYTCLCSIWFVLYSPSAFNWLYARTAQKVWGSPQCNHSTTHAAKWRLLSCSEAGWLEQWKQPVAMLIPERTTTWWSTTIKTNTG